MLAIAVNSKNNNSNNNNNNKSLIVQQGCSISRTVRSREPVERE